MQHAAAAQIMQTKATLRETVDEKVDERFCENA
jgi:hypothetical protein